MIRTIGTLAASALLVMGGMALSHDGPHLNDAQIAHIAYTAGALDVEAGKLALARSRNPDVRNFAETMVRDHQAVNQQALALVGKLGVKPEGNPTSAALTAEAEATRSRLSALNGAAFDAAYASSEASFHAKVNNALESQLIPGASNGQLKSLLETGLGLFRAHQSHAEQLSAKLR